ncbi:hypothetical protein Sjap_018733 [Stephania japonica]|uniref:Uncharacterized protein n=1 Tax=Stephania japonica TaxID=461633 RepID=A0AAP0I8S6_9MAGN
MKGREGKGAPPTDLLVCFPTRAHLTLMPKPICSPARPMEATGAKIHRHNRHMSRTSNRGGQASPLLWAKPKSMGSEIDDEPTSPKVTCAGQIKVRPKNSKNWQSVMEEIERIHGKNRSNNNNNNNKHTKKSWVEALGLKKDVMQFLTCLRGIRFDLRCFGSFHESVVTSDDEDEVEEEEEEYDEVVGDENDKLESMEVTDDCGSSRTVFSKWFMVLQENQEHGRFVNENQIDECKEGEDGFVTSSDIVTPPPNALLLMRCRSAPTKSWIEEKEEEESEEKRRKADLSREEEKKKTESLILKCYAPDFFKVSSDIAKETWVLLFVLVFMITAWILGITLVQFHLLL